MYQDYVLIIMVYPELQLRVLFIEFEIKAIITELMAPTKLITKLLL